MKTNPIEKLYESNSETKILLEALIEEGENSKANFWDDLDLKKIKTFKLLKNKPDHEKINFIFYMVDQMIKLKDRQRSHPEISSKNSDFTVFIYISNILNGLIKKEIEFKEIQIQDLFLIFYENRNIVDFNRWPLNYLTSQIAWMSKRETLSEDFLQFLANISKWHVFNSSKSYVDNDIEKTKQKLQSLVLKLNNKTK